MSRKRADMLLVERGHFESRARAQAAISAGLVTADGAIVRKASEQIDATAVINAEAEHPYVSRGGMKLAFALDFFRIAVEGKVALDVGASTGGFTDVLLRYGVRHVYAVDVGREQLHASLRGDDRVTVMEGLDARDLTAERLGAIPDLVVSDVSFISLTQALGPALELAATDADLVALVKPQFEAGRDNIGKGGIVRDEAARTAACQRVTDYVAAASWHVLGLEPSPITGGDGNQEFLLHARKPG